MTSKYLPFEDLPKPIQALVNGAEFLKGVRQEKGQRVTYLFDFDDGSEVWVEVYRNDGLKVGTSIPLAKERY